MDERTLFYIGIFLGFVFGVVLTLIVVKVKSLFSSTQVRELRQEKNKYIDEMMGRAEKLAHDFGKQKRDEGNH